MFERLTLYFKASWQEMLKVAWPTRKQTLLYTGLVVAISLAMAVFFGALDFGLTAGLEALLERFAQ